MNQSKTNYALEREVKLTTKTRVDAIRKGLVKLQVKNAYGHTRLNDVFDFSKLESGEIVDNAKLDPLLEKLKIQYDAVCDEIVLGDEVKAIELIKNFSK